MASFPFLPILYGHYIGEKLAFIVPIFYRHNECIFIVFANFTLPHKMESVNKYLDKGVFHMPSLTLDSILEGRRSQSHQLIEVLHDVQELYGYISEEAIRAVSNDMGVPLMEVYRVASFYKAFTLKPHGKNVITMCMGTACHVRGAKLLINQANGQLGVEPGEMTEDGLFSVKHVNCLGACALAPIVAENGSYHHHMTPGKLRRLIDSIRSVAKEETADV
jgi:NADH:ubiquinone oxidoreductase subunit E